MDKLYNVDKKGDREVPGQNGPCNWVCGSSTNGPVHKSRMVMCIMYSYTG
jgi:hypothetical protein